MCSLLQCVFKIIYMHSQCGSVFIDAFLQYSHVATLDILRDVYGQTDTMPCVVCFVGCVLDMSREREHDGAGRLQISVVSSTNVRTKSVGSSLCWYSVM